MNAKIEITPETKLGKLLEQFPEFEDELIAISPTYSKLKNPILRKTVGKVASLRQVAEVGNIPISELINRLRKKAGFTENFCGDEDYHSDAGQPDWFRPEQIGKSLDARPIIEAGGHPLERVMKELPQLESGKIYELITPFYPAPLIDVLKNKGYQVWSDQPDEMIVKNYFYKT